MLNQLTINNFAIISRMNIDFEKGLTVITGQTGAGKSIVVDAISQLIGMRANKTMVSDQADYSLIEGVFDINQHIDDFLKQQDIEIEDDYLIITKKIKKDGKSQIKLNNRLVTNEIIKNLGKLLIEIHSQQATYEFNNQANQQAFIDSMFNQSEKKIVDEYRENFNEYNNLIKKQKALETNFLDPDLLPFFTEQLKDIQDNILTEERLQELTENEEYYKNFEKVSDGFTEVLEILNKHKIVDNLYDASNAIKNMSEYSETIQAYSEELDSIYYNMQELESNFKSEYQNLNYDESEYEIIKETLYNYNKMIKKYGYSLEDALHKQEELETKIDLINNSDSIIEKNTVQIEKIKKILEQYALKIDEIRKVYIKEIEDAIANELKDLYLKDAKFKIDLMPIQNFTNNGKSTVNFMFSANKGSSLKPMNQVASGGEISRLMLALKVIEASNYDKVYIFDEIDTGVSGEVADAMGRKMKEIAKKNNAIVITHLPQVAAYANHHLFISKSSVKQFTSSNYKYLDNNETVEQLASMLSGTKVSDAALENAKELLDHANK
ncbi:DNA repair protein RecN [Mycoplasma sp. P36-A1]|uniref:DNA repair protein RecN n=1 Tax=Mycoplasma sp. P36-A1 TaxID=3252900 RepID=UPI003C2D3E1D